jgi:hypothetical protein
MASSPRSVAKVTLLIPRRTSGASDLAAEHHTNSLRLGNRAQFGRNAFAHIDDRRNTASGSGDLACRLPGGIIVGEENRALRWQHSKTVQIATNGLRQHDSRSIVASKDDRSFTGTGSQNGLAGDDLPETLTW